MKNLANCKPSEFLRQTYKIKNSVEKWLTTTEILEIRKNLPTLTKMTPDMTDEERKKVFEENKRRAAEQSRKNMSAILDAVMDKHAEETLEILALCCFIDPDKADDYPIEDYLTSFAELMSNTAVISFFTSLTQLGVLDTSNVSVP